MSRLDRRQLLAGCGAGLATLVLPRWSGSRLDAQTAATPHEIRINAAYARGQWFYDPVGLYIQKGQTVRWISTKYGASVTAFHPSNQNHELRIPAAAKPFDSGLLGEDSDRYNTFEWTFDVEGTYDYFSRFHEPLGLVGRIVVGAPGGPAEERPLGYGASEGRAALFAAQATLLGAIPSKEIVSKRSLPYPRNVVYRTFPYSSDDE